MTTRLAYNSPRQTCYAVKETAQGQFEKLVARPWNIYEPDTTMWWLVPSNDWPAYKHGKLYFNGPAMTGSICGLASTARRAWTPRSKMPTPRPRART